MTTPPNKSHWQQHINQWRDSKLSQAQYCKNNGLKENAFSYHKGKLAGDRKTNSLEPVKAKGFIKLPVTELPSRQTQLTLHLMSGLSLSGITDNNLALVKQLVGELS